ncbi:MAG: hypothetical protein Q7S21_06885 [archaeon]|nr:hypothetical protein [archaeon]
MPTSLIVNLNEVIRKQKVQRAAKALRYVKRLVARKKHIKPEEVLLSMELNEKMWERGMYNIPKKIELELFEEDGKTIVFLKNGKELQEKLNSVQEKKTKKEKKAEEKEEKIETKAEDKKEAIKDEEKAKKLKDKKTKEKAAEKVSIKRKTKK